MNAKAVDIQLNTDDIIQIESIIAKYPNTGERYPESAMSMTNR